MRGNSAHIRNIGTILRNEISHFHVSNSLWKLCHLRSIMAAQRHDKLLHVVCYLLASGFNCRGSLRMTSKQQPHCGVPSTSSSSNQHLNLEDACVQLGVAIRLMGWGGHVYIRSIRYSGRLWLDHAFTFTSRGLELPSDSAPSSKSFETHPQPSRRWNRHVPALPLPRTMEAREGKGAGAGWKRVGESITATFFWLGRAS